MTQLWIFSTFLLAYFQTGLAIRCWTCSSDLDYTCMDPFNATKLIQQRNYFQQVNYNDPNRRNGMPQLVECSSGLGPIYDKKQICVKRIINIPYGKPILSRECATVSMYQEAGACPKGRDNVEFCEYCDYDGCNAATGIHANLFAALVIPAALALFFRR